ncbi:MAG: radical SAM protein [Desulfovibrio sp.]|nr:MAG: radical SAM protein [Desulfovibrio sp.]
MPRILGINPAIYDFAAYNVWLRPMGLLTLLGALRASGASVALLDCLDPTWGDTDWPSPRSNGSGHFPKSALPQPKGLEDFPRNYSRYGLDASLIRSAMQRMDPPDAVLVTCLMTYWYPGALEIIRLAKEIWPNTPVVLGGVYPTLCRDHALAESGADLVVSGPFENAAAWSSLWSLLGRPTPPLPENAGFTPATDLYQSRHYSAILGSRGCPLNCPYCASSCLYSHFVQRGADEVWSGIWADYERGVRNYAFFDDALLIKPKTWLIPLLQRIVVNKLHIALHAPNAMHLKALSPEICALLKQAGLSTIRLGLETTDFNNRTDNKASKRDWLLGADTLLQAGFSLDQIGVYVLFGLPGQDPDEAIRTVQHVQAMGFRAHVAYYSPIPGSALFDAACRESPFPLREEPLFHNNSLWPCVPGGFSWEEQAKWKEFLATGKSPLFA